MAYLETVASSNLGWQNFFSAKLTSSLTASDTDIPMDTIPSVSEGVLVVDWDVAASREVIFFNSKTASKVVCPSAANGRGFDGSTATTHNSGANVIMAPVADYFRYIKYIATTSTAAWKALGYVPDSITDNGNRSYTMVFNSVDLTSFISNGMKLKGTPTTAQPTRCTSLNGTTQYYNKAAPGGTTFTDDFVAGGWIKPTSYAACTIVSRYNGTSGWVFDLNAVGQIQMAGFNAGVGNNSYVLSTQSVSLNRWTHAAGLLDMSAFTAAAATAETAKSWITIDGEEVTATVARGGTNPTALVQAGSLEVGSRNGGTNLFPGKLAQVFYTNTRLTQANLRLIKNQGITAALCTTHNIVSAYSFDNSINDINTGTANNLTANGSAVATDADSPYGQDDSNTPGTSEWGIVMSRTFSTNTTLIVQAPEGSTWPTSPASSAISAMFYSTEKTPYKFPVSKGRWLIETVINSYTNLSVAALNTWYETVHQLTIPAGRFDEVGWQGTVQLNSSTPAVCDGWYGLGSDADNKPTNKLSSRLQSQTAVSYVDDYMYKVAPLELSTKTVYKLSGRISAASGTMAYILLASNDPATLPDAATIWAMPSGL